LSNIKIIDEARVLVNHGNPEIVGMPRRSQEHRLSFDLNCSGIGLDNPGKDPHQGALSGTVLADQAVYFTGPAVERNMFQSPDSRV
jgi:hypothetical protein